MGSTRVYFNYRTVDGPWGGANTFHRLLKNALRSDSNISVVDRARDSDVILLGLSNGPGRRWWERHLVQPSQIDRLCYYGTHASIGRYAKADYRRRGLVFRVVTLPSRAYGHGNAAGRRQETLLFHSLERTDIDVFQSRYALRLFSDLGYAKPAVVIHNATDQSIFNPFGRKVWVRGKPLRLFSCTFSTRKSKGFDVIARFSQCRGVESYHVGAWPGDVDCGAVRMLGTLSPGQIAAEYRLRGDVFLHPAKDDPCPNAVVEALSCGLPVLYSQPGGTAELVGQCGLEIEGEPEDVLSRLRAGYEAYALAALSSTARHSIERAAMEYANVLRQAAPAP